MTSELKQFEADGPDSAFVFHGDWKEFAPIAFTNLLLTIVTLGVYRFWAIKRERQYLWSRAQFIDEPLEWTGTGLELFFGFILAMILFMPPLLFIQFGAQALALRGYALLAFLLTLLAFLLLYYVAGLARFRALRYRLGRTYWHGIRGGSEDRGFAYGWSFIWKSFLGYLPGGLLIPWSMVELWNERWNKMSFGSHRIEAFSDFGPLMLRFVLCYIIPFVLLFGGLFVMIGIIFSMASSGALDNFDPEDAESAVFVIYGVISFFVLFYGLMGLAFVIYLSAFYRLVVGGMSLSTLDFAFTARTKDWFKLILMDIVIVVFTLGIGWIFLGYRHWKFFIVHMEATGEIDLTALTQSTLPRARHGEGLLDALDIGAI